MPLSEPVLLKRIPTEPWGNPADRKRVSYEQYLASGGHAGLTKAMAMQPSQIVDLV